jgi:hypothetical protein
VASTRVNTPSRINRQHAIWEREMRRLRVTSRVLAAALLAVVARIIIAGLTLTSGLTATVIAALTVASSLLTRHGHRHEPALRRSSSIDRR